MDVGTHLRRCSDLAGLSQQALADAALTSQSIVAAYTDSGQSERWLTKLAARRAKDFEFCRALVRAKLITPDIVRARAPTIDPRAGPVGAEGLEPPTSAL